MDEIVDMNKNKNKWMHRMKNVKEIMINDDNKWSKKDRTYTKIIKSENKWKVT